MLNFRKYLSEMMQDTAKQFSKEELEELFKASLGNILVNSNGNLYAKRSIYSHNWVTFKSHYLEPYGNGYRVKYPLEIVNGDYIVSNQELQTMENFPITIKNGRFEGWLNKFSDLKGIPQYVGLIDLSINKKLKSFAGIGKLVKECEQIIVPATLESNLLGVILIKNLETISNDDDEMNLN